MKAVCVRVSRRVATRVTTRAGEEKAEDFKTSRALASVREITITPHLHMDDVMSNQPLGEGRKRGLMVSWRRGALIHAF